MNLKRKPYQFMLPTRLYNLAMRRAKKYNLPLAAWLRIIIEKALKEDL